MTCLGLAGTPRPADCGPAEERHPRLPAPSSAGSERSEVQLARQAHPSLEGMMLWRPGLRTRRAAGGGRPTGAETGRGSRRQQGTPGPRRYCTTGSTCPGRRPRGTDHRGPPHGPFGHVHGADGNHCRRPPPRAQRMITTWAWHRTAYPAVGNASAPTPESGRCGRIIALPAHPARRLVLAPANGPGRATEYGHG